MNTVYVKHEHGNLRQEISIGRHHLITDESLADGGEDTGPSPFEYLCAALASCTAITLRMYAQRKGWPLENAQVSVVFDRSEDRTTFNRTVDLIGALTPEQRQRLLEIANRCPVHKILTNKIVIQTELLQDT